MAYTFEKEQFSLLEKGEYEAVITDASIKLLSTGSEKVSLTFKIREDVNQNGKNRLVYDNIWKEKENQEFFDRKKINRLLGTQNIKEGTTFEGISDILNVLNGSFMIIKVDKVFNDYLGKDENRIVGFKRTKNPLGGDDVVAITEDDLPF